jgi:hypothetical protein
MPLRPATAALLEFSLALPYTEMAEPLDILGCVVAVPTRSTSCKRQGAESLTESQPARGYAEFFGCLCNREYWPRFKHVASIEDT